ncbi:MAG TPA: Nif3-like dinuclear metal center hexameric protein [Gemmatimonadales bacterium]|nr:Nif3-like dinuclear metal center hexameric protein [Gemmatimonadales bacterium]
MNSVRVPLSELQPYLDEYLGIGELPDEPAALNGLQVENSGQVARLVAAVDASQATLSALGGTDTGPPLVIVHHGLFWDGLRPLTGRRLRKVRSLLAADAALYAAHIPLDVHPEVGNNAVLARRLGLLSLSAFAPYKGILLGQAGNLPSPLTRAGLAEAVARDLGVPASAIRVVPGGPDLVSRIGIVTGAGSSAIAAARETGCDALITGEGPAHSYFDAMELGVSVLFAGHYATETVGVQALCEHLASRFGLPWAFHDHPTGM